MKNVSKEIQDLSIKSLESTLNKLTKAYKSIAEKGSNTTLIKKRQSSLQIGLESLKNAWGRGDFFYDEENILACKDILEGIMVSIEKQIAKAKKGSSQKTLNQRRITAIKLAIESLENRLNLR